MNGGSRKLRWAAIALAVILLGYVGWKDLMRVRSRKQAEERDRSTLLGFGTRRGKKAGAVEST